MFTAGLSNLTHAQSRSISAENPTGEKGKGAMAEPSAHHQKLCPPRELGKGWKCRPAVAIPAGETFTLADIRESGMIQSMWFGGATGRDLILRIYWDGQPRPSVECPLCAGKAADLSMCWGRNGTLQESALWLTGREFAVEEVECRAMGAPACVWEISKTPKK